MEHTANISRRQRYRGSLLGLAAGDAVGTTLEFKTPGSFTPISDMVGGGPFGLHPGQWTDDTSMALCLAHSLVECQGFDASDQMQRYLNWSRHGYMSSNGRCFDIGVTVSEALSRFLQTGEPLAGSSNPFAAGNGCIMRLAPVVIYFSPNLADSLEYAALSARTTHGAKECVDATTYFASLLHTAYAGQSKAEILASELYPPTTKKVLAIAQQHYRHKTPPEIKGTGYVIDCLEAALWSFASTDNFRDAVLTAANLGDDADTTAAVVGQIAGAYYGEQGIPEAWLSKLVMRSEMEQLADQLGQKN
ncbi:ADP-ribosylglycohydrolase family protein [Halioxenophilus sp. WMMB6]|uniref:ADP-ribosylglycohydrolase family protein n=1 Tax=Halioxenophilus sp. WMMB6 TaxID=3073815 RepID=UPI00295E5913|nr:ADP-ribosylglycohydrolase family protein [Halioxenophilus sp. WMMB6]